MKDALAMIWDIEDYLNTYNCTCKTCNEASKKLAEARSLLLEHHGGAFTEQVKKLSKEEPNA
jgi:hypothetical protein